MAAISDSDTQVDDRMSTDRGPSARAATSASWLATPLLLLLAVVCCAGPLLLGVLAASGAGAWLAAHGYTLGAVALIVLAALLTWGRYRLPAR